MKILELADEVFYGFASSKVKFNPEIHEYEMTRSSDGVRLKIYFGGEVEDIRIFNFKDFECLFFGLLSSLFATLFCFALNTCASASDPQLRWMQGCDRLFEFHTT